MNNFELKDAISLFYTQTSTINGLWTVYVAATFAAGGFSELGDTFRTKVAVAIALSIAFGAFTFGNWRMLRSELAARWQLSSDLHAAIGADVPFHAALSGVIDTASEVWKGRLVHMSIDTCVFIAIWVRVFLE